MADWNAIIPAVNRLLMSEEFDVDDISAALDMDAIEFRYTALTPLVSFQSGGVSVNLVFVSPDIYQNWNSDLALVDTSYDAVAPQSIDYVNGRFIFATDQPTSILISGFSADPYAAAARLLDSRAAALVEDYQTFSTQNGSFSYPSKSAGLRTMAEKYRSMARVIGDSTGLDRVDVNVF